MLFYIKSSSNLYVRGSIILDSFLSLHLKKITKCHLLIEETMRRSQISCSRSINLKQNELLLNLLLYKIFKTSKDNE